MMFPRNFWREEQGQDLIEYTLLMAFVALASAALFIGAGGTGMEVMMRIRRRILSEVWNRHHPTRVESIADFPVARFLHFDLDNNAVIDEGKSQRTDPWYELVRLTDEERLVEPLAQDLHRGAHPSDV